MLPALTWPEPHASESCFSKAGQAKQMQLTNTSGTCCDPCQQKLSHSRAFPTAYLISGTSCVSPLPSLSMLLLPRSHSGSAHACTTSAGLTEVCSTTGSGAFGRLLSFFLFFLTICQSFFLCFGEAPPGPNFPPRAFPLWVGLAFDQTLPQLFTSVRG